MTTVSTFADVTRRLELCGYRYVEETNVLGKHYVSYTKNNPNAAHFVDIVRWSGDPRLKSLIFYCDTDYTTFNSKEARHEIWRTIDADVCAMINGTQDYLRALADMKEVDGDGLPRIEGQATTAEGWQIHAIEYVGYYKRDAGTTEKKIGMAWVDLTNMETDQDMPASAVLEFNRQLEEAKDE